MHKPEYSLDTPVDELDESGWSVRTTNCLRTGGYATLRDVAAATRTELLRLKNFGRKSMREVVLKLAVIGSAPWPCSPPREWYDPELDAAAVAARLSVLVARLPTEEERTRVLALVRRSDPSPPPPASAS